MNQLEAIFAVDRSEVKIPRGVGVVCILALPLVVLSLLNEDVYWLSASFGALFVGLGDPGGTPRLIWDRCSRGHSLRSGEERGPRASRRDAPNRPFFR